MSELLYFLPYKPFRAMTRWVTEVIPSLVTDFKSCVAGSEKYS